jgi:hypothetical protein
MRHTRKSKFKGIHSYQGRDDKGKCERWSSLYYSGRNHSAVRTSVPGPNLTTVRRTVTVEVASIRAVLLLKSKEKSYKKPRNQTKNKLL